MNKLLMASAGLAGLVLVVAAGWYSGMMITHRPAGETAAADARTEYDKWVSALKADEKDVRQELLGLISGTKVTLDGVDQARVSKLTFTCDDPNVLLEINQVETFVRAAGRGETNAYAFVTAEQRPILENLAGANPSAESVLKLRASLGALAREFELLRRNPDWNVEVTGEEKVAMPMLDMLREGYEFLPYSKHPALAPAPVIPAFASADAELLAQLETYFNGARAKAAFPVAKFPNAYVKGKLPAVPASLGLYRKEIQAAIDVEKKLLLPGDKAPPADAVEAVDDVYRKLEKFMDVVGSFGK